MKIVLNPQYKKLDNFVKQIPSNFNSLGETIQNRRNVIKTTTFEGLDLNIKRYKKPIFINRIIYSFFRKPKAYKAYNNALAVVEKGFDTPNPISYIEETSCGLISLSYFISVQLSNVSEIREFYFSKVVGDESFLTAFAQYTAHLHNANILHLDYSPGNILFSESDGYHFSLVDINRMKFCEIDIRVGCENFCRLFEYDDVLIFIASIYAKERGLDIEQCKGLMLHYKHQFEQKKERKKMIKKIFK